MLPRALTVLGAPLMGFGAYQLKENAPVAQAAAAVNPEEFIPASAAKVPEKKFDSYMVADDDLVLGSFRLLEVDNRIVLPTKTHTRLLITSFDVLHSWTIPAFGIKLDACPGRLNQASLYIKRPGVFYGQCSEICGVNHAYMPIVVHAVPTVSEYVRWLLKE